MKSASIVRTVLACHPSTANRQICVRIISRSAQSKAADDPEPLPASFEEPQLERPPPEKKDVSRLRPQHQRMLREEKPYLEPHAWIHTTQKYNRMMFGRYGLASGVDPRICFQTQSDIEIRNEYEQLAYEHTVPEMMEINRKAKEEKLAQIRKREEDIEKKVAKLEQWTKELNARIAKKEASAQEAKERKERIVEEVRRHFGFKVDPRDDRFKEMLEQKEREAKKRMKEAKRQAKESKMMDKLKDTAKKMDTENVAKDENSIAASVGK